MTKLLLFLSGKKGIIASLMALINGYLMAKGFYGELDFYFIGGLQVILFGAASIQTKAIYANQ